MKKENIKIIKILLYLLLIIFLIFILYLVFLQPYTKSGTHLFTQEECDNSYDCKCNLENDEEMWCTCKYKKWFIESRGNCIKSAKENKLTSTLKNKNINLTHLVRVNGELYSKSPALLDYLGSNNQIGVIDKLIDEIYIPKLEFETNNKDLLNAKVFEGHKGYTIVLYYNNEYVLFEKVKEK